MCFDICTINIRVSIRVRGLHLVFLLVFHVNSHCFCTADLDLFPVGYLLEEADMLGLSGPQGFGLCIQIFSDWF